MGRLWEKILKKLQLIDIEWPGDPAQIVQQTKIKGNKKDDGFL